MTDAQFDLYMQHLERLSNLDKKGATAIGRLYTTKPQVSEAQRDVDTHHHNDEWTGEHNA